jgi:hypothetical protein
MRNTKLGRAQRSIPMAIKKPAKKATANGWKTCTRGHKFRGTNTCPVCWPGGAKKRVARAR